MTPWQPGDLVRIDTPAGGRFVQITHIQAPYPPILRVLAGETAQADTTAIVMADLPQDDPRVTPLGPSVLPAHARAFPTFRLAVRDRTGAPIYWWNWDGEGLRLAPDGANAALPLREVTPLEALIAQLAAL